MHAQLIEVLPLKNSVWMSFWDVDAGRQVDFELPRLADLNGDRFVPGGIYQINEWADAEHLAIERVGNWIARQLPKSALASELVLEAEEDLGKKPVILEKVPVRNGDA